MLILHNINYDLAKTLIVFFIGSYMLSQFHVVPIEQYNLVRWYILHKANAWTSILYALPNRHLLVKIPLVTLSIASFSLWANSRVYIQFIDVTSIYWVIVTVSLYIMPYSIYNHYVIGLVNSAVVTFIGTSIYYGYHEQIVIYYNENLIVLTGSINTVCLLFINSVYLDNAKFNISILFIICGYVFKLLNIYYNIYWGTAIFHTFTAIGIHILLCIDKPTVIKNMERIVSAEQIQLQVCA